MQHQELERALYLCLAVTRSQVLAHVLLYCMDKTCKTCNILVADSLESGKPNGDAWKSELATKGIPCFPSRYICNNDRPSLYPAMRMRRGCDASVSSEVVNMRKTSRQFRCDDELRPTTAAASNSTQLLQHRPMVHVKLFDSKTYQQHHSYSPHNL